MSRLSYVSRRPEGARRQNVLRLDEAGLIGLMTGPAVFSPNDLTNLDSRRSYLNAS